MLIETKIRGELKWNRIKNSRENLSMNLKQLFQKIKDFGFSKISKLGLSLLAILTQFLRAKKRLSLWINKSLAKLLKATEAQMIGPIEKGIAAARVNAGPDGIYEGVDLRILPKFISYKAALMRERITDKFIILILSALLVSHYAITRFEIAGYHEQLRTKEFMIVPGAMNFASVSPHSIKDSEIRNYITKYLSLLGNINSRNIEDNYSVLLNYMSPELALRFEVESESWIESVKLDDVTEILTILEKEIVSDGTGLYRLTALARRGIYQNGERISDSEESIEMKLKLLPPSAQRAWYPEIIDLKRKESRPFSKKKTDLRSRK
jgi:hypothetical protein